MFCGRENANYIHANRYPVAAAQNLPQHGRGMNRHHWVGPIVDSTVKPLLWWRGEGTKRLRRTGGSCTELSILWLTRLTTGGSVGAARGRAVIVAVAVAAAAVVVGVAGSASRDAGSGGEAMVTVAVVDAAGGEVAAGAVDGSVAVGVAGVSVAAGAMGSSVAVGVAVVVVAVVAAGVAGAAGVLVVAVVVVAGGLVAAERSLMALAATVSHMFTVIHS